MTEADDIKFMRRCLELALKAEGLTYPNPMVGSVIVYEGKIIGEGYHLKAGDPHAEVIAINSVKDKTKLSHAVIYVNLEPCSHIGRTPPCADLIISHKIPRVVIGTKDTSEKVSGRGIDRLKKAGCNVITGVAEKECRILNRRFFTFHEKKRPYITLKWAESSDRYLDIIRAKDQKNNITWITGKPERVLVHKWRASEQAILVGAGTFKADNPGLNVREWTGPDPIRIILSGSGSVKESLADYDKSGSVIVFTHNDKLKFAGAVKVKLDDNVPSCKQVVDYLFHEGIQSIFIEGGASVLNNFISDGLWDEARVFTGKTAFNEGVMAPKVHGKFLSETVFSGSTLNIYSRE